MRSKIDYNLMNIYEKNYQHFHYWNYIFLWKGCGIFMFTFISDILKSVYRLAVWQFHLAQERWIRLSLIFSSFNLIWLGGYTPLFMMATNQQLFNILKDKDLTTVYRFRTTNHKLPTECGRWCNLPRKDRSPQFWLWRTL
jgi:hypothetical protein